MILRQVVPRTAAGPEAGQAGRGSRGGPSGATDTTPEKDAMHPASIPGIVDVIQVGESAHPDLIIEIPHGATTTGDYERLAAKLTGPLPEGLIDFFYVNTDSGAPELAQAIAERLVAGEPSRTVTILRCRIPRTFIDCNRVLDLDLHQYEAGNVAPGLFPWVDTDEDSKLLRGLYDRYMDTIDHAVDGLAPDGAMLLMHTYAPRTVGVEVDMDIVQSLHWAYQPEVYRSWPERPEIDIVGRTPDGTRHAPPAVVEALEEELDALGMAVGDSHTYPMHPSTMGYVHAMRTPGRTMCLEVRRDLIVERFEPFSEAAIDPERVGVWADRITRALRRLW